MTIAGKPQLKTEHESDPKTEEKIDSFIHKGGSVANPEKTVAKQDTVKSVQLRIPSLLLKRIDNIRANKPIKPLRHPCFLEAIYEWIVKEEAKQGEGTA